jgi:hypothetical protein
MWHCIGLDWRNAANYDALMPWVIMLSWLRLRVLYLYLASWNKKRAPQLYWIFDRSRPVYRDMISLNLPNNALPCPQSRLPVTVTNGIKNTCALTICLSILLVLCLLYPPQYVVPVSRCVRHITVGYWCDITYVNHISTSIYLRALPQLC